MQNIIEVNNVTIKFNMAKEKIDNIKVKFLVLLVLMDVENQLY